MSIFAPIVIFAVLGIMILAFRLYKEATDFTKEVQIFLNLKTVDYNKERAKTSILKTKIARIEKENSQLKKQIKENESMKIAFQKQKVSILKATSSREFIEKQDQAMEKLEKELVSIQNVLNRDIRSQLKGYQSEVEWLSKRLNEVQNKIKNRKVFNNAASDEITSDLAS